MKTPFELACYILTQAQTNFLMLCDIRFHRLATVSVPYQQNMLMQTVDLLQASYNWANRTAKFPYDLNIKYHVQNSQVIINTIGADAFPTGALIQYASEYQDVLRAEISQHNIIAKLREHIAAAQASVQISSYFIDVLPNTQSAANDIKTTAPLDVEFRQWMQNLLRVVLDKKTTSPLACSANALLNYAPHLKIANELLSSPQRFINNARDTGICAAAA